MCIQSDGMKITYDPDKCAKNVNDRALSFERASEFDFSSAKFWQDERKSYTEPRFVAIGYLDNRLHVLCFADTASGVRVISFRKANQREGDKHGLQLTRD